MSHENIVVLPGGFAKSPRCDKEFLDEFLPMATEIGYAGVFFSDMTKEELQATCVALTAKWYQAEAKAGTRFEDVGQEPDMGF